MRRRSTRWRVCEKCGKEFYPHNPNQRFCSIACFQSSKPKVPRPEPPPVQTEARWCPECGSLVPRNRKLYCSRECRHESRTKRKNDKRYPHIKHVSSGRNPVSNGCLMCGKPIPLGRAKFCSDRCKNESRHQKRRARLAGVYVENVSRHALRERDGDVCGICGDSIDFNLRAPDPMAPSLDHIVPLCLGGEHSMANCQLAHLVCNSRKGGRLMEESA